MNIGHLYVNENILCLDWTKRAGVLIYSWYASRGTLRLLIRKQYLCSCSYTRAFEAKISFVKLILFVA